MLLQIGRPRIARGQRRLRRRILLPTRLIFAAGRGWVDFLHGAGRGQCRDGMRVLPLRCRGRAVGLADELLRRRMKWCRMGDARQS